MSIPTKISKTALIIPIILAACEIPEGPPVQPSQAYDPPPDNAMWVTSLAPNAPSGIRINTAMVTGQLETYTVKIEIPSAFTFNGFNSLGPPGTSIGANGVDFDASSPGVIDARFPAISIDNTSAFVDAQPDGVYDPDIDALITITPGNGANDHEILTIIPRGGDRSSATITIGIDAGIQSGYFTGLFTNPGAGNYDVTSTFTSVDPDTDGANDDQGDPPEMFSMVDTITIANDTLFSAVAPGSRFGLYGSQTTAFASLINASGGQASNCAISLGSVVLVDLDYQTTDPATNTPTGTLNSPVFIADGQTQSFVITLTASEDTFFGAKPFPSQDLEILFTCDGGLQTSVLRGVNTLFFDADSSAKPDIIAIAATPTADGIWLLDAPTRGTGAFGGSAVNIGAADTITIKPRPTISPFEARICDTTGNADGSCNGGQMFEISQSFATGQVRTFSVFAVTSAEFDFLPATNRVFVDFIDSSGKLRGSTSVAVQLPPQP